MLKKADKKYAETVDKALNEGFDLSALLDGASMARVEIKVYTNTAAAARAVQLNGMIEDMLNATDDNVRTIADAPVDVEAEIAELKTARAAMEESAVTFRLRALSNTELLVIRRQVAHTVPIAKKLSDAERAEAEAERAEVVNEHALAVATLAVVDAAGRENKSLSVDDAHRLREVLPTSEWQKLSEGVLEAMARAQVADQMMSDPSFRWADSESGA